MYVQHVQTMASRFVANKDFHSNTGDKCIIVRECFSLIVYLRDPTTCLVTVKFTKYNVTKAIVSGFH